MLSTITFAIHNFCAVQVVVVVVVVVLEACRLEEGGGGGGGGGASIAGLIASNRFNLSVRDLCHFLAAATRRAQCTEQKRPDPYDISWLLVHASHAA